MDADGIKLIEYNADTPSLQLESGPLSMEWFTDKNIQSPVVTGSDFVKAYEEIFQRIMSEVSKLCIV